jgi:hypothetical protein
VVVESVELKMQVTHPYTFFTYKSFSKLLEGLVGLLQGLLKLGFSL